MLLRTRCACSELGLCPRCVWSPSSSRALVGRARSALWPTFLRWSWVCRWCCRSRTTVTLHSDVPLSSLLLPTQGVSVHSRNSCSRSLTLARSLALLACAAMVALRAPIASSSSCRKNAFAIRCYYSLQRAGLDASCGCYTTMSDTGLASLIESCDGIGLYLACRLSDSDCRGRCMPGCLQDFLVLLAFLACFAPSSPLHCGKNSGGFLTR